MISKLRKYLSKSEFRIEKFLFYLVNEFKTNHFFNMEEAIIIDNGSALCKIGMADNETPQSVFPAIIGRPKYSCNGLRDKDIYVGNDAFARRSTCKLSYPNKCSGKINPEEIEKMLHHIFYNELSVDPSDHPVLLIEKYYKKKDNIEQFTQLLFETFNVPGVCIGEKSVLSLLSTGRNTGIVLHSGDYSTYACPIYESKPINRAIKITNVGGYKIDESIKNVINYRFFIEGSNKRASEGLPSSPFLFKTSADDEIIREIKEKYSYVAFDYDQELANSQNSTEKYEIYRLPDQTILTIQDERFMSPEILFKPQIKNVDSVDKLVYDSIKACDDNIQNDLFDNIVLSGGTTMINGFAERFTKEMQNLVQIDDNVNVIAPQNRINAAFIGGAIYANLTLFQNEIISKDEYNENGPGIASLSFNILSN